MTSRPARLNVKTCISNDNFLLGSRRVKHLSIVYWLTLPLIYVGRVHLSF